MFTAPNTFPAVFVPMIVASLFPLRSRPLSRLHCSSIHLQEWPRCREMVEVRALESANRSICRALRSATKGYCESASASGTRVDRAKTRSAGMMTYSALRPHSRGISGRSRGRTLQVYVRWDPQRDASCAYGDLQRHLDQRVRRVEDRLEPLLPRGGEIERLASVNEQARYV